MPESQRTDSQLDLRHPAGLQPKPWEAGNWDCPAPSAETSATVPPVNRPSPRPRRWVRLAWGLTVAGVAVGGFIPAAQEPPPRPLTRSSAARITTEPVRPVAAAPTTQFLESFEPASEYADVTSRDWAVVADTANTTAAVPEFVSDNTINVVKLTRVNHGISAFTTGYLFVEHDIDNAGGETTTPGDLYGEDAGDVLLWTTKPLAQYQAESLDLNGATFAVDYQHGDGVGGGAPFHFAVQTAAGAWWALEEATIPRVTYNIQHVTKQPIAATVDRWRQILRASGAPGQRLRLAETPTQLPAFTLANIVAVGLYLHPTELLPSRFDNFSLVGFGVNPLPRLRIQRRGTDLELTWSNTLNSFALQARTSAASGAWQPVGLPVTFGDDGYSVTLTGPVGVRFFQLKRP